MTPEQYILAIIIIASVLAVLARVVVVVLALSRGRPDKWLDDRGQRLKNVILVGIIQRKIYRDGAAGFIHGALFGAFAILLFSVVEIVGEGFIQGPAPSVDRTFELGEVLALPWLWNTVYFLQDIIAALGVIAVFVSFYRRRISRVPRLQHEGNRPAQVMLVFILGIIGSFLLLNVGRILQDASLGGNVRPVSTALAFLIGEAGLGGLGEGLATFMWWFHVVVLFAFMGWFPYTKHAHIIFAIFNVYLHRPGLPGAMEPVPPEQAENPGARTVEDLTRFSLLNGFACTECGRCSDTCPAHASGTAMDPMHLMMGLREAVLADDEKGRTLLESVHSADAIWSCMTCYSCVDGCPVLNDHLSKILEMRRHMIMEGQVETGLQRALENLSRYGNSFRKTPKARKRWARKLEPPVRDARAEEVEYLWFLGDYAAYDTRCQELTQRTADVFARIGFDFGTLQEDERNSGNDIRRVGEEGLFEQLREQNLAALEGARYRDIVTTDPHTYNTLKHEYQLNGGQVLHYTELLDDWLTAGRLTFSKRLDTRVAYHDPCYLGRYNGVYDAPRRVLEATGVELVEMPRNRYDSFCCGAGGGRIWMEECEGETQRPADMRVEEAAGLGVEVLVVACPKDYVMFQDAVKTTGLEHELQIKDIIDLMEEAL